MHNINIIPVLNGWQIQVGCQQVVFDNVDKLLSELRSYLVDPEVTSKRYLSESVNSRFVGGQPMPMAVTNDTCAAQEIRRDTNTRR